MISREAIFKQIHSVTAQVVELSLCDEQSFPTMRAIRGGWEITVKNATELSIVLKNISYREIYDTLEKDRVYNFKMLDGALIQLLYKFDSQGVVGHRLAFFPSPDLEDFQNDPEIYLNDEVYADIVGKNIVAFPIRFDFLRCDDGGEDSHPASHLTLGQFQNCRIPVSAPLTPFAFIDFIFRNFYNTAFQKYTSQLNLGGEYFTDTIRAHERQIAHVRLR